MQSLTVREMCPATSMWCITAWWRLNSLGPKMRRPHLPTSSLSPAFWFQIQSLAQVKTVHILSPYLKRHSSKYTFLMQHGKTCSALYPKELSRKFNQKPKWNSGKFFFPLYKSSLVPPAASLSCHNGHLSNECNLGMLQEAS